MPHADVMQRIMLEIWLEIPPDSERSRVEWTPENIAWRDEVKPEMLEAKAQGKMLEFTPDD